MKVQLSKINVGNYKIRDSIDEDHVKEIAASFEKDGQWDPIIIRTSEDRGTYDLVAGEHRLCAAKTLRWSEIEATVRDDIDDSEADFLALKTNMYRKEMLSTEEGKAIKTYMERHNMTQKQVAEELRRSVNWVSERLILALDICKDVKDAISSGGITLRQAVIISQIKPNGAPNVPRSWDSQREFLSLLLKDEERKGKKLSDQETRQLLKWFQNDVLCTIGYSGKDFNEFVAILKKAGIEQVVDIRDSGVSTYKPEFSSDVLKNSLASNGIDYIHCKEFGVPYDIRTPYISGDLKHECFSQWYTWSIRKSSGSDRLPGMVKILKSKASCLMCSEASAKPTNSQKIHCHRDLLADLVMAYRDVEMPVASFSRRVDL
jgi:ParB family chromosome partitioning protein